MDLVVLPDFSVIDIVESLCDKFRRRMTIAFAERPKNSTDLKWKTHVVKDFQENQLIAFELPEMPQCSVFVPVRLLSVTGIRTEELDSFFLVNLPSEHCDLSSVEVACLARFDTLFCETKGGISDFKLQRLKAKLGDGRNAFAGGELLKCSVFARGGRDPEVFSRNDIVRRISNHRIDVLLNPAVIADDARFAWHCIRNRRTDLHMGPAGKRITKTNLRQCILDFAVEERLDVDNMAFCPHCRDFFRATKKMDLWSVPEILVLHLKRFYTKGAYQRKLDINCEYPEQIDMREFVIGPQNARTLTYRLVGLISHSGGLGGGHYVADVYHDRVREWIHCSDDVVKATKDVHSDSAYVLFYQAVKQ
jgi:hypothetical protein